MRLAITMIAAAAFEVVPVVVAVFAVAGFAVAGFAIAGFAFTVGALLEAA